MTSHEILQYFQDRQDVILELIREIVDIESPSFNIEQSEKVTEWIEQQAFGIPTSLSVERYIGDGCGKHILIGPFEQTRRHTLLLGHTDTVHPIGTRLRNPTRIEGDKFYGCGIFDMKANIVLMLEVLRFFAVSDKKAEPFTIFLSCDEEVGSKTGRPLIEREAERADRCFVLEPSDRGRAKTGRKGTGMYKLHAHGIPSHAGLEPEKGANAVVELSRQVEKIQSVARTEIGTTVNVTTFHGGTTLNVIPEDAECEIDVRFTTAEEAERVDTALRSLQPVDPQVTLETDGGINRMPLERTDAVAELFDEARRLAATFDYELGETQVGGGSDGNFVAALGVPVLDGLGITGDGAHTLHEHILASDIAKRATLLTTLLYGS